MGNIFSFSVSCDAVFSRCVDCTFRKVKHLRNLEDNIVTLQIDKQKLVEIKNDVIQKITVAEQQSQMKRTNQVEGWLLRVEAFIAEVEVVIKDSSLEMEKLFLGGYCYKNYKSSYNFGRKVVKMLQHLSTLKNEGTSFEVVVDRVPVAAVDTFPIDLKIVGQQSTFDEVWRCLTDKQSGGVIGVYGKGGVGKTTLSKQINNNFLNEQLDFDVVIWVVVAKDPKLEKIQEDIGKRIGLLCDSWKNKTCEDKARDMTEILSKKRYVFLLDDIWKRLELTEIGVPLPSLENVSKIIFTTCDIEVFGFMKTDLYFKVEPLGPAESWDLFQENLHRDVLDNHPSILRLANLVAEECGGLPLVLKTIGRVMACKKTPEEWKYAIQVSKRSASSKFPGMDEVFLRLKFSYDNLQDNRIKSCFLYCSLFPDDYNINKRELIDYWSCEGFLEDFKTKDTQNEGCYIIGILLNACLLEEGEEDSKVKMHDVIRDMALWIACEIEKEGGSFLVRAYTIWTELPKIKVWTEMKRISFMENTIQNLSEIPTCPRLQTLLLRRNLIDTVSNSFFQYMPCLKVLDLSYNHFKELPPGISRLVSLEYLNLSNTAMRELPEELKALVNLKYLNLEYVFRIRRLPSKLISSFSNLQVLRMLQCIFLNPENVSQLLIEELLSLKKLTVLNIKSSHALEMFIKSNVLKSCTHSLCLREFEDLKSLEVSSLAKMKHLDVLYILFCKQLEELKIKSTRVRMPVRKTDYFKNLHELFISSCSNLRDLTGLILAPHLKFIRASRCSSIEEIINEEKL